MLFLKFEPLQYMLKTPYLDCSSIYEAGYQTSGVYSIWLTTGYRFLPIYCDMDTPSVHSNKRGWMVIQRRFNGQLDFNRNWQEYVDGFGSPYGEYWLGLENIYQLAWFNAKVGDWDWNPRSLRIELTDWMGFYAFAEYKGFSIQQKNDFFKAILGPRFHKASTRELKDNMQTIDLQYFSTSDFNNQEFKEINNCAEKYQSGWWFTAFCGDANLNGPYPQDNDTMSTSNIYWKGWDTVNPANAAIIKTVMKIQ